MSVWATPLIDPNYLKGMTKEERFEEFHALNPQVYRVIVLLANKTLKKGHRRWSMKGIFEVIRWNSAIKTSSGEIWKLNNDFTAFYARKVMAANPKLDGFFELRQSEADK